MARPAVAEIVGERKSPPETVGDSIPQTTKIPGTSLAPRQKEKLPTTPSSKKQEGEIIVTEEGGEGDRPGRKNKGYDSRFRESA